MENSPGQRLRQWRDYKGLKLADVSRDTGIKTTTLSTTEQPGASNPSYDTISKVLAAYPDLNPDWLLLGTGSMLRDGRALSQLPPAVPSELQPSRPGLPKPGHATPAEADFVGRLIQRLETELADAKAREEQQGRLIETLLGKSPASAYAATYPDEPRTAPGFRIAAQEAPVIAMWKYAA